MNNDSETKGTANECAPGQVVENSPKEDLDDITLDDLDLEDLDTTGLEELDKEVSAPGNVEIKNITTDQLTSYMNLSDDLSKLKENYAKLEIEFKQKHMDLINNISTINTKLVETKQVISDVAIIEYNETKCKKLLGGISIRAGETLTYDSKAALTWAKTNMAVIVSEVIDTKTFEKYAKTAELDFVTKNDKITVCFPKQFNLELAK